MAEQSQKLTIALCGNPNSGKTTLFNALCHTHQHIGNWAGVTVESKMGKLYGHDNVDIIDLPGIYSLTPLSPDEKVAHDYLDNNKPDLIINIVDSTNLSRNLFLTTQLMEHCENVIVALNMQDELLAKGKAINADKLQQQLGCKCICISAAKGNGIDELIKYVLDGKYLKAKQFAYEYSTPHEEAAARYKLIDRIADEVIIATDEKQDSQCADCAELENCTKNAGKHKKSLSDRIDDVVTNKWLAFPIFFGVMLAIFFLSIEGLGGWLSGLLNDVFSPWLIEAVRGGLSGLPLWLSQFICDGILTGVLAVVGFAPQIMLLFGLISCLEASGYMSRIVFIMDRLLSKIGLSGKSFVALITGCGCSVPAIMSARTIKSPSERKATVMLCPMMPCSAKIAMFSFFTAVIFGGKAIYAATMYFVAIGTVILGGLILKLFKRKEESADTFLVELPPYRAPRINNVLKDMWDKGKGFLIKAGTVIFAASVVLWVLTTFNWRLEFAEANASMLAGIGKVIAPVFAPLGFGQWQFAVATLSGIAAKETTVTTLEILFAGQDIATFLSPLSAYSFMCFNLLCAPCVAAIATSFKEMGRLRDGLFALFFQTALAYLVTLLIYQTGRLATNYGQVFWTVVILVLLAVALGIAVWQIIRTAKKGKCGCCEHCALKDNCASTKNNCAAQHGNESKK